MVVAGYLEGGEQVFFSISILYLFYCHFLFIIFLFALETFIFLFSYIFTNYFILIVNASKTTDSLVSVISKENENYNVTTERELLTMFGSCPYRLFCETEYRIVLYILF